MNEPSERGYGKQVLSSLLNPSRSIIKDLLAQLVYSSGKWHLRTLHFRRTRCESERHVRGKPIS